MGDLLSIGEVADRAGVPTSTLRYYDALGLVEPRTRMSGQRRYEPQALQRLRIVELCQRAGFTLKEIHRLLDADVDWRSLAADKLTELDQRIRELREARRLVEAALACDCDHLEGCDRTTHDTDRICGEEPSHRSGGARP